MQPHFDYARSGDLSIAYQVVGEGPIDLVFVPFTLSSIVASEFPPFSTFFERLASFSRLILFDKRGIGASDRPRTPPTLEAQMDDVRAVLDAVGSERAALFGSAHGGQMCALFAATYPERTSALVLFNPRTRFVGTAEEHSRVIRNVREQTGRPAMIEQAIEEAYPSLAGDEDFRRALAFTVRLSTSPGAAAAFWRTVLDADVSEILPTIRVPTLVLYRNFPARGPFEETDIDWFGRQDPEGLAREVAAAIPNARAIGLAGGDGSPFMGDEVANEVEQFLTAPLAESIPQRVLATVLFTDIVSSTERAASLGDHAWRSLLASHRAQVRRELARFAGVELDTTGDGFFASFDGPARAITCAQTIVAAAAEQGLELRAGLHTGECEREDGKLAGIAVHIGARIADLAQAGEVVVSRTVKDLVAGSGIEFHDRGEHQLKGVPGKWQLFTAA